MASYRNQEVPGWFLDYLPQERNPFQPGEKLVLDTGCLAQFWNVHSSNKHPRWNAAAGRNAMVEKAARTFGTIFTTWNPSLYKDQYASGRNGYHEYCGDTCLKKYAKVSEDKMTIEVLDAHAYYNDVVDLIIRCLWTANREHYPPPSHNDGWSCFFPSKYSYGELIKNARKDR